MATITKYRKKDGTLTYTGQIRIRRKGVIVHTEAFTHAKLSQVKAWAKRRETELAKPGVLEATGHKVSVESVLDWYLAFGKAGRTKTGSIEFLKGEPIAQKDAVKLTVDDLLYHASQRKAGGAQPPTILQDFIWLRLAMQGYRLAKGVPVAAQAVEDATGLLRQAKAIGAAKKRTRRPTVDELDRLLDYFSSRDGRSVLPMVELVLFALFSARRQDEICRLRWEDLDGDRILVRDMKHPRQVRDTWVWLTDEARAVIDRQPRTDDRIFPFNGKSASAAFTRSCKVLGIADLHFHDLRHECASWLFEMGWDIPRVAGVTGHQSWSSLQRYTHIRERGDKYKGWAWRPTLPSAGEAE
jgi:integrase